MTPKESEKNIETTLVREIKRAGGLCLKLSPFGFAGIPDRICLLPGGRVFFVELKTTGKKPAKLQIIMHEKLKAMGFEVLVIDRKEQIKEL